MRMPLLFLTVLGLLALPIGSASGLSDEGSCAWEVAIRSEQVNALYPDEAANYWVSILPLPPGAELEITGEFPHARYISFITYDPKVSPVDGLADVELAPDDGATNPMLDGADRTAEDRSYTLRVVQGAVPAQREPNTIYTMRGGDDAQATEPLMSGAMAVAYRVYRTDLGTDVTGDVGLPRIAYVLPDGSRHEVPECPDRTLPDTGLTEAIANAGGAAVIPEIDEAAPPEMEWRRYHNVASSFANNLNNGITGPLFPTVYEAGLQLPRGGYGENIHNAYAYTTASWTQGDVAVFRAKAPTVPQTFEGQPVFGSTGVDRDGDDEEDPAEVRYWSFCSTEQTTRFYGCLTDDQVPVDDDGYFTIVVSRASNRPANAVAECGVAWLPAGPLDRSVLIYRHMLPSADFEEAIQHIEIGSEEADMGEYYPAGEYLSSASDFEALGC